ISAAESVVAQCQAMGGDAWAMQADVSSPDAVQGMVDAIVQETGRLDVVVNNALRHYAFEPRHRNLFDELSWQDYQSQFDGAVGAVFNVCRAVLPHVKQRAQGCIINLSTNLAEQPVVPYHDYTTAKAALTAFSRNLAVELGPFGIRVNCGAPGLVYPTDASSGTQASFRETLMAATPLRRI